MKVRSIRHKLMAAILLTAIVALLVSGTAMVIYNLRNYHNNQIKELTTQAALLGRANTPSLQFDDPESARAYLDLLEEQPAIRVAAIYDARGKLFATYRRKDIEHKTLPVLPERQSMRVEGDNIQLFNRIVANNEILGTVYLLAHYKLHDKLLGNLGIALAVFMLALVVATLLSFWLQSSVTRPILSVTSLARKVVERRDYSLRAEKTTDDEIGYLVDGINAMLSEVEHRNDALEQANKELACQIEERREVEKALRRSEQRVLQLNAELEQRVKDRTLQLQNANRELEAFSYSVSHDLRAPLRAIDGFSQALLEDYDEKLDDTGRHYLSRVRAGAQRMGILIDDLLNLSRVSRIELNTQDVNLSEMAEEILEELRESEPERIVNVRITSGLKVRCDPYLIRIALQNLLSNAWKYTSKCSEAFIEFGMRQQDDEAGYFVQDNGVGFDMAYAHKLFGAFQRLHDATEFPGTGVGLATVQRIIHRHGGRIWAQAAVGEGAAFYFTLPATVRSENIKHGADYEQQTDIAG